MGMTIGLSTALSGLLTSQKGLDVISQNITNVNTPGYVRKVMTPESVDVNGGGAGVQSGPITRTVDEGLMAEVRTQASTQAALDTAQQYYPQIEQLFGQVGSPTSMADQIQTLQSSFETLSGQVNSPSLQDAAVQSLENTATQLSQMTTSLQSLRLQADKDVQTTVGEVNDQLSNINDLNQQIVRGLAVGSDVGDLQDQRDTALTTLSKYMNIQYFNRGDGSVGVYTKSGQTLVENGASTLSHVATSVTDSWMTAAGGNYDPISLTLPVTTTSSLSSAGTASSTAPSTADISSDITGGNIRALLDMRDTVIPSLQAQVDELASKLKDNINQVNNRGMSYPNAPSQLSGTRQLMDPNNNSSATGVNAGLIPAGLAGNAQKIWLSGTGDTTIAMFDSTGTEIASTTLKTIMSSTAYNDAAGNPTALDISANPVPPGVALVDVAAKIQNWMKAQTYQNNPLSNATASISTGKFVLNTGNTGVSLGFRDQVSSTKGAAAGDVTVNYDVDGDGSADQTVSGFSNFFGLNDLITKAVPNSISDSNILPANYTTTTARTFRLLDPAGQVGNAISIPAGTSLAGMAAAINNQTQTNESSVLSSTALTLTTPATIGISDPNGTVTGFPITLPTGTTTDLNKIAAAIDAVGGSVQAKVVQNAPGSYQLEVWDSRGQPLTLSVAGGTMGTTNLGTYLGMKQAHEINATVIPDGSGYRLRIRQSSDQELYVGATPDNLTPPGSIITDLGLHASATRTAGNLAVRPDIQGSPSLIASGSIQYNADLNTYSLSEGDNSTTLQMAKTLGGKISMASAGDITAGSYTLAEYASASIAVVSTNAAQSKSQQTYQTTLGQSLNSQYTSLSGVNLDQEVANMINFQQAYSASAKVISTLQQMLDTLVNIIH